MKFHEIAETIVFAVITAFLLVLTIFAFRQSGVKVGLLFVFIIWLSIGWGRMFTMWDIKREVKKALAKKKNKD